MDFRLTKEQVNDRIVDRGLVLIGDYINAATKTTFRCDKGHEWEASPDNVMNAGTGCPICAGNTLLTKEEVN